MGDGVEDLARMELERGECLSPMGNKETRERTRRSVPMHCLVWLDLQTLKLSCGRGHGWQRPAKTPNSKLGYLVSRREIDCQSRATDLPDTICLSSGGVRLSAEAILWFCRRIFICTSVPRAHHHTAAMSANPNQLTYSIFIANL